ncbi:chitin synthase-domain-containing protein [Lipomyces kononenkoae]|uniref:Chitin synthase-domain-containing protein n=1 Tax=Lipomyces kononenkoae TaxID=34357 RepID=A0ACC3T459_LIPKO
MDLPLASSLAQPSAQSILSALQRAYGSHQSVRLTSTVLILFDSEGPSLENPSPFADGSDDDLPDSSFLTSIWEHARRRAEDQAVLICSGQSSKSPDALAALQRILPAFPNIPGHVFSALAALSPFLAAGRKNTAVGVDISLDLSGQVLASRIRVSDEKADTSAVKPALFAAPVFQYLIASATESEQKFLSLHSELQRYGFFPSGSAITPDVNEKAREWRQSLLECGLAGTSVLRSIFSVLSGILLLKSDDPDDILEGATLLGLDPEKFDSDSILDSSTLRLEIMTSAFKSLTLVVVGVVNKYLSTIDVIKGGVDSDEICAVVSIIDTPPAFRSLALRPVFVTDNAVGSISSEMANDGLAIPQTPLWISQTLQQQETASPLVNISSSSVEVTALVDESSILAHPSSASSSEISTVLRSSRVWHIVSVSTCDQGSASQPTSPAVGFEGRQAWSNATVASQIRTWFFPNWIQKYKAVDFTADFGVDEFVDRYSPLLRNSNVDITYPFALDSWAQTQRGWGADGFFHGRQRIWLREDVWRSLEGELDGLLLLQQQQQQQQYGDYAMPMLSTFDRSGVNTPASRENLLNSHTNDLETEQDLTMYGSKFAANDPEAHGRHVEVRETSTSRKAWVGIVWALTFWIPGFVLKWVGRMKRPDIRMAWREKLVICFFILLLNSSIIFYMIFLGTILCPDFKKVWDSTEVAQHTQSNNFYVSIHGKVYDISSFWKLQHSDNGIQTTEANMNVFAGLDLSNYFPPPLTEACPGLVTDDTIWLSDNTTVLYPNAVHTSGPYEQQSPTTALHNITWYSDVFLPKISQYYKGELVVGKGEIESYGQSGFNNWAIIDSKIYDLTNYFYTINRYPSSASEVYAAYDFLDPTVKSLFQDYPGQDITQKFYSSTALTDAARQNNLNCLQNAFYAGEVDFRNSARCQVANYILLAIAIVFVLVILVRFVASIRFGSNRNPDMQDKFVICQVPAYTEGEDQLRKAIDSLTALKYDNKRKLLFIICDGMIIGSGNDKPTPQIVLDILGADPRLDPPPLQFKSVGDGSLQLNYGKIYSGLYEFEGNVVPYIVVVKVGKPSEKSKPGNRGKRDSQVLLLDFLNRVHFKSPMSPLQLEIFHQINNVIGVDPELYEYVLMVDADTSVAEDSLNRLVACCAHDSRIAGIAGETSLQNEEGSWWTMIQVYEYYISHHLAKAFESLFGSVSCLPGCFCMYRLRTADKGRPLIIASQIIEAYSDGQVDTLHKKNLLALGEDRYLTTLMTKHFPRMRYVFTPDAFAQTAAPETWSVLLSQRRRWINSTIHNLAELMFLPDMCGFCIFSMRFVVVIDLVGTLMLPSVVVYFAYLLYLIISKNGPFPLISIILIGAIYGLQALVFILRRQWQHVGWMVIYLLASPIYFFVLPVYSFWNQDNFSWGNTRIVVGERGNKQIVAVDDEGFDDRSIPMQTWEAYAAANNLPGGIRPNILGTNEKTTAASVMYTDKVPEEYELDDMRSTFSGYPAASVGGAYSGVNAHLSRPGTVMSGNRVSSYYAGSNSGFPAAAVGSRPQSSMTLYQQQQLMLQQRQSLYSGYTPSVRYSSMSHRQ